MKKLILSLLVAVGLIGSASAQLYVGSYHNVAEYDFNGFPINESITSDIQFPTGIAVANNNIYVPNYSDPGTIRIYSQSGTLQNSFSSYFLRNPNKLTIFGDYIFVSNAYNGSVGLFTTSGTLVNSQLISGLNEPSGISIFGGNIFVANQLSGVIGEYSINGTPINTNFITGLNNPTDLTFSSSQLFVTALGNVNSSSQDGYIASYNIDGSLVNSHLVTNLNQPQSIAYNNGCIYVGQEGNQTISKYNIDGTVVNANFIIGVNAPYSLFAVPEPSTYALFVLGAIGMLVVIRRKKIA